jgi:hypothetical protein
VNLSDREHVKTALRILSRNLTSKAEALEKVHQTKAAKVVQADIGELDEVLPRKIDDFTGVSEFSGKQRDLARTAVGLYIAALKAAANAATAIGREDWTIECEDTAEDVQTRIAPMLDDQPALPSLTELAANLAPEPGSGVESVTFEVAGHEPVTLTQEDGERLRAALANG